MFSKTVLFFVAPAICAALGAYGSTWLARLFAARLGFVDKPDGGRKRHTTATPLLGGLAVFLAFFATAQIAAWSFQDQFKVNGVFLWPLLLSGSLFCLLGLWDDRMPLRARDKLLLQILASLPFAVWGPSVESVDFLWLSFDLGPLALPFSVFWLVASANVVNLVDGLDGLATTFGMVAALTLAVLALIGHRYGVACVSLIFAGSLAGFLAHNWPPAKIFLGDAGSLTIGFLIGALAMEASVKMAAGFMLTLPLVMLSIPILDTSMAILRRKLTGRGIGDPDRRHIHHLLQDRGLSKQQTLLIILGLTATMAGATVAARFFQADPVAVFVCAVVIGLLVSGRVFGVHELSLVFRHITLFHAILASTLRMLGARSLLVRIEHAQNENRDVLWAAVRQQIAAMGVIRFDFVSRCLEKDRVVSSRTWSIQDRSRRPGPSWEFRYSINRGDSHRTQVHVVGHSPGKKELQLGELFRVFDTVCRHWPVDEKDAIAGTAGPHAFDHTGERESKEVSVAARADQVDSADTDDSFDQRSDRKAA